MNKKHRVIGLLLIALCLIGPAYWSVAGGMKTITYTIAVIGNVASSTNSKTYVVRGMLDSIYVDGPTLGTNTVIITDAYGTIFSLASITADAQYFPTRARGSTTGGDIIFQSGTTDVTNSIYGRCWLAGQVTVKVIGQQDTITNTVAVTLLFKE